MNVQLKDITVTARDGRVSHLEQVYIRGSHVRFFIVPDMLRYASLSLSPRPSTHNPQRLTIVGWGKKQERAHVQIPQRSRSWRRPGERSRDGQQGARRRPRRRQVERGRERGAKQRRGRKFPAWKLEKAAGDTDSLFFSFPFSFPGSLGSISWARGGGRGASARAGEKE